MQQRYLKQQFVSLTSFSNKGVESSNLVSLTSFVVVVVFVTVFASFYMQQRYRKQQFGQLNLFLLLLLLFSLLFLEANHTKVHVKTLPTFSRHEADGRRLQEVAVQLCSVDSRYVNLEVVHRVRAQAHLPEDGSDVVLKETIETPRHLERAAENGEGSSKLAVVVGVAQFKLHVSARADSLLKRQSEFNSQ